MLALSDQGLSAIVGVYAVFCLLCRFHQAALFRIARADLRNHVVVDTGVQKSVKNVEQLAAAMLVVPIDEATRNELKYRGHIIFSPYSVHM